MQSRSRWRVSLAWRVVVAVLLVLLEGSMALGDVGGSGGSVVGADEMREARDWATGIVSGEAPGQAARCVQQGWGRMQNARSMEHQPLTLGGKVFSFGLGTCADSEIVVKTGTSAGKHFHGFVGVDDNALTRDAKGVLARVAFSLEADGKELWKSAPRGVEDAPLEVNVDLGGAGTFTLRAAGADGKARRAYADWCEPVVALADGRELRLGNGVGDGTGAAGVPFSFTLGGKNSAELLAGWKKTVKSSKTADGELDEITWRDEATGMECRLAMTVYADSPAVEWVVYFKNTGSADSAILDDVQGLNVSFPCGPEVRLDRSRGSQERVDDFLYSSDLIPESTKVEMNAGNGRSSNNWLPYFNVESAGGGVVMAIGWSGEWAATFDHRNDGTLNVRAGMRYLKTLLHPGEEIRSPRMLLLFWKGIPLHGNNMLRQFNLHHKTPRVDGQPVTAPLCFGVWGSAPASQHLKNIAVIKAHHVPYDVYWIDAGWYGDSLKRGDENDWYHGAGNWYLNKAFYPGGMRVVSDAAADAGMKFLLWMEPERAIVGTKMVKEHPDWFLEIPGREDVMLNLGNPAARAGMTQLIAKYIDKNNVKIFRQDFNFPPLEWWRHADGKDREGMTEMGSITGLYAMWDEIREKHPGLYIDNCASGGRRLDLELATRGIPLWRSDYECNKRNPVGAQVQTMGLSYWLPLHGTCPGNRPLDNYQFRCALSAAMQFYVAEPAVEGERAKYWEWVDAMISQYRRARPFFYGDYYPLTTVSTGLDQWAAFQLQRPDLHGGLVLALRREESPYSSLTAKLSDIDPAARYEVEDVDLGTKTVVAGAELIGGFEIRLGKPRSSKLLFYTQVSK